MENKLKKVSIWSWIVVVILGFISFSTIYQFFIGRIYGLIEIIFFIAFGLIFGILAIIQLYIIQKKMKAMKYYSQQ